ncbi:MAG: class I SAM-dependent methyltransferase [Streptosporangiaceae bacterium]
MTQVDYWNHNVHYQPVILRAVPPGCGPALDVGCGDGLLACRLAERCGSVTGIDSDAGMIAVARRRAERASGQLTFVEAASWLIQWPKPASTSSARTPHCTT